MSPPGPRAETRRLWVTSESGFVWSMNWESWEEPKNSLMTADTGLALMMSCGISVSMSCSPIFSRMARSTRTSPMRNWFSMSSPTVRTRRFPRLSMSSASPVPFFRSMRYRMTRRMSSCVKTVLSRSPSVMPSLWFSLSRPTRERLYRSGLKNMFVKSDSAASFVGGSPGRIFL